MRKGLENQPQDCELLPNSLKSGRKHDHSTIGTDTVINRIQAQILSKSCHQKSASRDEGRPRGVTDWVWQKGTRCSGAGRGEQTKAHKI